MNFLEYQVYVIGCLGVGDIICSFNALENIGRERGKIIQLFVVNNEFQQRVFDIYNNFNLQFVNLTFCNYTDLVEKYGDTHTVFQAFGDNVSWVDYWLKCWGLVECVGYKNMISIKRKSDFIKDRIGISFTVTSNKEKNVTNFGIFTIIDQLIDNQKNIIYFGYRGDDDLEIYNRYNGKIEFCERNFDIMFNKMSTCEEFIGADSGMAWISAFCKIKTRVIIGEKLKYTPYAFSDIPWVSIEKETISFKEIVKFNNNTTCIEENQLKDIKSHLFYINRKINDDHNLLVKYILENTYKDNRFGLKSYSQLGQDNFVYDILEMKKRGIFVDIGASEPITYSNTYGLETQLDWTGVLVESNSDMQIMLKEQRRSKVYQSGFIYKDGNSNINDILLETNATHIDYLSVDIDGDEYEVIKTIDFNKFTFSIIDVEHDIYRHNKLDKRNNISNHLSFNGYHYFYSVGVDDIFISTAIWQSAIANFNKKYGYDIRNILP